jgi:hypothetical protein
MTSRKRTAKIIGERRKKRKKEKKKREKLISQIEDLFLGNERPTGNYFTH